MAALPLDLQHIRNVDLVGLQTLHLVLPCWLLYILVACVFEDYSIEFGQVYVLYLRIVHKGDRVFVLCALAQFLHLFVLMSIVVIGFGEAVCQIMEIFMCANGFEKFLLLWGLVVDIYSHLLCFGADAKEELGGIWTIGRVNLQHIFNDST